MSSYMQHFQNKDDKKVDEPNHFERHDHFLLLLLFKYLKQSGFSKEWYIFFISNKNHINQEEKTNKANTRCSVNSRKSVHKKVVFAFTYQKKKLAHKKVAHWKQYTLLTISPIF